LLVRVHEHAVDGSANEAVVQAVAQAFGLRARQVRLVHGRSSRRKLVEIDVDDAVGSKRIAELKMML
jgi:uncharacterized protein YggU (UPF0235/DUF167 family)